jgi:hypothetical protein
MTDAPYYYTLSRPNDEYSHQNEHAFFKSFARFNDNQFNNFTNNYTSNTSIHEDNFTDLIFEYENQYFKQMPPMHKRITDNDFNSNAAARFVFLLNRYAP